MSVKEVVNFTMIAGGRKDSTTKDLKVLQIDFDYDYIMVNFG